MSPLPPWPGIPFVLTNLFARSGSLAFSASALSCARWWLVTAWSIRWLPGVDDRLDDVVRVDALRVRDVGDRLAVAAGLHEVLRRDTDLVRRHLQHPDARSGPADGERRRPCRPGDCSLQRLDDGVLLVLGDRAVVRPGRRARSWPPWHGRQPWRPLPFDDAGGELCVDVCAPAGRTVLTSEGTDTEWRRRCRWIRGASSWRVRMPARLLAGYERAIRIRRLLDCPYVGIIRLSIWTPWRRGTVSCTRPTPDIIAATTTSFLVTLPLQPD